MSTVTLSLLPFSIAQKILVSAIGQEKKYPDYKGSGKTAFFLYICNMMLYVETLKNIQIYYWN